MRDEIENFHVVIAFKRDCFRYVKQFFCVFYLHTIKMFVLGDIRSILF